MSEKVSTYAKVSVFKWSKKANSVFMDKHLPSLNSVSDAFTVNN